MNILDFYNNKEKYNSYVLENMINKMVKDKIITKYENHYLLKVINDPNIINLNLLVELIEKLNSEDVKKTYKDKLENYINLKNDDIVKNIKNIKFTNDQTKAMIDITNFLVDYRKYFFGFYGFPGTGKTTVIMSYISHLIINKYVSQVVFCAPTHKAVTVLKTKFSDFYQDIVKVFLKEKISVVSKAIEELKNIGITIEFLTLHKLLGYKGEFDINGNKIFAQKSTTNNLSKYQIVVIDECSMINEDIVNSIMKLKSKIIFVGDPAQLPPVNEESSSVFNHSFDKITMNEIVRNSDTKIISLFTSIRNWINGEKRPSLKLYKNENVQIYKNKNENKIESKWFNKFIEHIKGKTNVKGSSMILAWTNKQIDEYNEHARNIIFDKKKLNKYEIGDFIIFNEFHNTEDGERFYTSEQVIISSIKLSNKQLKQIKYNSKNKKVNDAIKLLNSKTNRFYSIYEIGVKKIGQSETIMINVIDDKSINILEKDKETSLNIISDLKLLVDEEEIKKIWSHWNNIFIDYFAQINYGYAITVHKAQGSGFANVFVDLPDIIKNKNINETKRCIYTALTRSEKTLQILF